MVIERYLAKEILSSLFAVLTVILLIFVGRYFARYLAWAAEGFISGDIVMDLLVLRTLSGFNLLLPFGLYLGVLIAFGRLYKDSEMTAFEASGVGIRRIIRAVFSIALLVAAVVAALSMYVSPWAFEKSLQIQEKAEASSEIEGVLAGQFNQINTKHEAVIYVENVSDDKKQIENVFVQKREAEELDVFSAKSAHQLRDKATGDRYIVLVDGFRYQGVPGSANFNVQQYKESAVRVIEKDVQAKGRGQRAISSWQLWQSNKVKDKAELYFRLSLPVSTILLALLGVLLSHTSPRQGRFGKLFVAILVLVIFNNAQSAMRSWVEQGQISPELGMWGIQGISLLIIAFMFMKQVGFKWIKDSWQGNLAISAVQKNTDV
ncbi:LPS export ABC transporter permease LptF [Kaarinaea lacus]